MIKCVIVEDEPHALKLLSAYVEKIHFIELVGAYTNPLEALSYINDNQVDVVLLDIQMPELNGIHLARVIKDKTEIIFTTAFPNYAVQGFEIKALDYLVKPISFQRFLEAVMRIDQGNVPRKTTPSEDRDYIFVKTEYRVQKVKLSDILYFKGMGDYAAIHTSKGRIMTLENMKSFQTRLPSEKFIRVHKSYIISFDRIEFIEKNRITIGEELIPIGSTYSESFYKKIKI